MKKKAKPITTAAQVAAAGTGVHSVGGATGLYLRKSETGSGSWFYRYWIGRGDDARRREMGLGPLDRLSLAEARKQVREFAARRDEGRDPIETRRQDREANLAQARVKKPVTFREATEAYLEDHAPTWKHRYAVGNWLSSIVNYAYPIIGGLALDAIEVEHIRVVIKAANKAGAPEAARRVRAKIEAIIDDAMIKGQRDPVRRNPAEAKFHTFAKRRQGDRRHYRAVAVDDAPEIFRKLKARAETSSAFAAWIFMIATAARPSEALGARWPEIDPDKKLWTIPKQRMKGAREHKVPLSSLALQALEFQAGRRTGDAMFPGHSRSSITYSVFADAPKKKAGLDAGTPHGWRSVFRDWAGDIGDVERETAEGALAHSLDGTEAAYRRLTAVEKRRATMEAYARWLEGGSADNVVAFPARA